MTAPPAVEAKNSSVQSAVSKTNVTIINQTSKLTIDT